MSNVVHIGLETKTMLWFVLDRSTFRLHRVFDRNTDETVDMFFTANVGKQYEKMFGGPTEIACVPGCLTLACTGENIRDVTMDEYSTNYADGVFDALTTMWENGMIEAEESPGL